MKSVLALLFLGTAVAAVEVLKKEENTLYRCNVHSSTGITVKERKFPIYLCSSAEGEPILFASDNLRDETLEAVVDKATVSKLREGILVATREKLRPKRQFGYGPGYGGGGGYGGASSYAGSAAGGGGLGGGFGGPFGGGGVGAGGGFSMSAASANAGGFGGGGGYYG